MLSTQPSQIGRRRLGTGEVPGTDRPQWKHSSIVVPSVQSIAGRAGGVKGVRKGFTGGPQEPASGFRCCISRTLGRDGSQGPALRSWWQSVKRGHPGTLRWTGALRRGFAASTRVPLLSPPAGGVPRCPRDWPGRTPGPASGRPFRHLMRRSRSSFRRRRKVDSTACRRGGGTAPAHLIESKGCGCGHAAPRGFGGAIPQASRPDGGCIVTGVQRTARRSSCGTAVLPRHTLFGRANPAGTAAGGQNRLRGVRGFRAGKRTRMLQRSIVHRGGKVLPSRLMAAHTRDRAGRTTRARPGGTPASLLDGVAGQQPEAGGPPGRAARARVRAVLRESPGHGGPGRGLGGRQAHKTRARNAAWMPPRRSRPGRLPEQWRFR